MHHANQPDPEMSERLSSLRRRVRELEDETMGATGRFPEGKLTDADAGEIRFRTAYLDGKVVLDFGQPVAWLGMSPTQAKDLARNLMELANPVTRR